MTRPLTSVIAQLEAVSSPTRALTAAPRPRDPRILDALGHLGAVLAQALPTDDQGVLEHVREAQRLLREVMR